MNSNNTQPIAARPLRNVDLCRQVSALRCLLQPTAAPIFPDADAVPAARDADSGLRQLFRRPVTVPWLANTEAYRSLAE